jgi:AraC-like DNA-binding protein
MDAVTALLEGPRARDAFLVRCSMEAPWAIEVRDGAPLTVMSVVRGSAWVVPAAGEPVRLGRGDVALARGPEPYVVADEPGRSPTALILEGQRCVSLDGAPLDQSLRHGVRTWGNSPHGRDVLLIGTYTEQGDVSGRLLSTLPSLAVVGAEDVDGPLLAVLEAELEREAVGQGAVLDRLLDLVFVTAVRAWLARPGAAAPGWCHAMGDPVVGTALRLVHDRPAEPWTVASLAAASGVSRAALARRFTALVGETPMAYLTEWRISLAADRLREPGATVTSVAAEVGYGSAFAFSTAFKRHRGISPRDLRAAARAAG